MTCSDIDGDNLNITWYIYYANGTLKETTFGESYIFIAEEGSTGTYIIEVRVNDGESQAIHQWMLTVNNQL